MMVVPLRNARSLRTRWRHNGHDEVLAIRCVLRDIVVSFVSKKTDDLENIKNGMSSFLPYVLEFTMKSTRELLGRRKGIQRPAHSLHINY